MDECTTMVVMHTGSYGAVTAPSITCMTSHTYKMLVHFITNLVFASALNSNREDDNGCIGRQMG